MRHNFPIAEALEAAGVDRDDFRRAAPGVDPDRLLVREAHHRFQWLLKRHGAFAFPYVIYMHTEWYTRPRRDLAPLAIKSALLVSAWRDHGYLRYALRSAGDYLKSRARGETHENAWLGTRFERAAADEASRLMDAVT